MRSTSVSAMGTLPKKKILYVITKGNFGGAQRYVFDLATTLPKDRFDVVVAFGEGSSLDEKLKSLNIRTIKINQLKRNINPLLDFGSFFELIKLFRNEKPDVVHLNSSKIGGLGALAGRITGIRNIIFTAHGWAWNEDRSFFSKKVITLLHWVTILLSHKTIAVSENIKNQIERLPFIKGKIVVIWNGISSIAFADKITARQKLGSTIKEKFWIGTIGELHKNKGLDFLIEAFSRITLNFPESTLIIVGEGEERKNLEHLIMEKGLQQKVHILGYIHNAAVFLKAFDIFTLTSRTEALPYVLPEAGLAECAVIATKVGGIPEIITSQKSGILIEKGNITHIEQALEDFLKNDEKRALFGKNLKQEVQSKFTLGDMAQKTIALYN
jgi:glycosyltransferase involved in cell wall biosynthesis